MREGYSVSPAELRAIPPEQRTARSVRRVFPVNRWVGFMPASTKPDDGESVFAPDVGTGRWEVMESTSTGGSGGSGGDGDLSDLLDRVAFLESETLHLSNEISNFSDVGSSLDDLVSGLPGAIAQILAALFFEDGLYGAVYDSGTNKTTLYTNYLDSDRWIVAEVRDGDTALQFEVVYESGGSWARAEVSLSGDYSSAILRVFIVRIPYEYEIATIAEDAIQGIGGS